MDENTRQSALDKIDSMKEFIGYPAEFLDNKKLDEFYKNLEIVPNDYLQAGLNVSIFKKDYTISQLRKPVNKSDWTSHGASSVVNAYFSSQENSIGKSEKFKITIFKQFYYKFKYKLIRYPGWNSTGHFLQ